MKYTQLGNTDMKIAQIIMGCWAIGGGYTWGDQDEKDSIATVHTAIDVGINCFDTAEYYSSGYSEEVLGKALVGKRNQVVIATKIWIDNMSKNKVVTACEGSLKRLKTDYIDLYQIHWPNRDIPLEDTLEAMEKLKKDGKVRMLGVCNFGVKDVSEAVKLSEIVTDQLAYSLLFRAIEYEILQKCQEKQVGILAYSPLAQGLLTGKFARPEDVSDERARIRFYSKDRPGTVHDEDGYKKEVFEAIANIRPICEEIGASMTDVALAWVLRQPGVIAALAGARRPEQITENVKAADLELPEIIMERLQNVTEELKTKMGSNADPWRTKSRIQ